MPNVYLAFYKAKRLEVTAESSYAAQQSAAKTLGAKKSHEVTVMLVEKGGEPVTHRTFDL